MDPNPEWHLGIFTVFDLHRHCALYGRGCAVKNTQSAISKVLENLAAVTAMSFFEYFSVTIPDHPGAELIGLHECGVSRDIRKHNCSQPADCSHT
jgi:hypothetical protein